TDPSDRVLSELEEGDLGEPLVDSERAGQETTPITGPTSARSFEEANNQRSEILAHKTTEEKVEVKRRSPLRYIRVRQCKQSESTTTKRHARLMIAGLLWAVGTIGAGSSV
ncbi:hypothetical protein HAX54_010520, partial [Datura stramonium]|nr:hypothetical protein [Datura stramonium]